MFARLGKEEEKVVLLTEPEENVLQCCAARLVSLGEYYLPPLLALVRFGLEIVAEVKLNQQEDGHTQRAELEETTEKCSSQLHPLSPVRRGELTKYPNFPNNKIKLS